MKERKNKMIKIDILNYGVYLDGNHTADFEDLDVARWFAYMQVDTAHSKNATIIDNFTGEVVYTADEVIVVKTERKVREGD